MSAIVNFVTLGLVAASLVAAQAPEAVQCTTLLDAVNQNGLSRLGDAVLSVVGEQGAIALAGLAALPNEVSDDQKITIFAPADEAWPAAEALPTGGELVDVLLGHVVDTYLPSEVVLETLTANPATELPTSAGTTIDASLIGSDIYVAAPGQAPPGALVIMPDIETCVGVIHVIDALLLPGDAMAPGPADLGLEVVDGPIAAGPAIAVAPGVAPALPTAPVVAGEPAAAPPPLAEEDDEATAVPPGEEITRELGDGVVGVTEDPSSSPHMLAGSVLSATAAAFALLA